MIKKDKVKFADGSVKTYYRVTQGYRPKPGAAPKQRTIKKFGYIEDQSDPDAFLSEIKEFNDSSVAAPSFGFDFDLEPVSTEVAGFGNVLDEFGKSLYTGSVDPEEYLPKLQEKLEATGIDKVIEEMQKQIDEWKEAK